MQKIFVRLRQDGRLQINTSQVHLILRHYLIRIAEGFESTLGSPWGSSVGVHTLKEVGGATVT